MSDQFVIHEGQLCRKIESFEAVDVAQLASKVESDQSVVDVRKNELELLQAQLDVKSIELEDAESVLENSKRTLSAATALVDESADAEATDGTGGENDNTTEEQVI